MLFTICPVCRLVQISAVICVLHEISASFTQEDYYSLSRSRSIAQREEDIRHSSRTKSISEIDAKYLPDTPSWTSKRPLQCSTSENILSDTPIKVCPSYQVMDVDKYRNPMIIFQTKCRCLHCQNTWFDGHNKLCQPLFEFWKVDRVTGADYNGEYIYSKVWEPVSYACACRKKPERRRHVMSP